MEALAGRHVPAPWTRRLKRARVTEMLRRLCFVMLGPLWEDAERPPPARDEDTGAARLPDGWTPGSLPAFVAAPALLALATFVAAEDGVLLAGISWDSQILLDGEKAEISAETLPWHLSAFDAGLALDPLGLGGEPFAMLLSAIRCDVRRLGSTREERRRRHGIGSDWQRRRLAAIAHQSQCHAARDARQRRAQAHPPADQYALDRLIPRVPTPKAAFGEKSAGAPQSLSTPPSARTAKMTTWCIGRAGREPAWRAATPCLGSGNTAIVPPKP